MHSVTDISYIDCRTAGLQWQAFSLFYSYLIYRLWDCGTSVAGIFTLLRISHILTVGLRDYSGRHFHSFTHISYTDCGTAVAGIFSHISYIDCGTVELWWQAFSLFHSHLIQCILTMGMRDCGTVVAGLFTLSLISIPTVGLWDCGGRHLCLSLIIHHWLDCGGTKAILIFHSHIYIMTTGPRTVVFRTQCFPSGPLL